MTNILLCIEAVFNYFYEVILCLDSSIVELLLLSSSSTTPDGSSSAHRLWFLRQLCAVLEVAIIILDKMVKIATAFFTVEGSIFVVDSTTDGH